MIKIKWGVFDRIELLFGLIKKHIVGLMIPVFIYQLCGIVLLTFFMVFIGKQLSLIGDIASVETVSQILTVPNIAMIILFFVVLIADILIGIIIGTWIIGGIKQLTRWETDIKIDWKNYFFFGKKHLWNACKVYWYMFVYVWLLPCIVLIIGLAGVIIGSILDYDMVLQISNIVLIVGVIYLFINLIYRGMKSMFALFHAIDTDDFWKEAFYQHISYTDNQWWRIFWNMLLVGIILGTIVNIIQGIVSSFFPAANVWEADISGLLEWDSMLNAWELQGILEQWLQLDTSFFITQFVSIFLMSIYSIVFTGFIYILYLRLKRESEYSEKEENETSEL